MQPRHVVATGDRVARIRLAGDRLRSRLLSARMLIGSCGCSTTAKPEAALFDDHPAAGTLYSIYDVQHIDAKSNQPTGITKRDYLQLIQSSVDFWKQHQNASGAIVDPYENKERQY